MPSDNEAETMDLEKLGDLINEPSQQEEPEPEPVEETFDGDDDTGTEDNEDDEPEPKLSPKEREMAERLRLAEEKAAHFQKAHDRLAGEVGRLKRIVGKGQPTKGNGRTQTEDDDEDIGQQFADLDEMKGDFERLRAQFLKSIGDDEERRLYEDYPEARDILEQNADERERFGMIVAQVGQGYRRDLGSNDPDRVRSAARLTIREAWDRYARAAKRVRAEALSEREKRGADRLRRAKGLASNVGGQSGSTRRAGSAPRSVDEMTTEQIEAALRKAGRRGF